MSFINITIFILINTFTLTLQSTPFHSLSYLSSSPETILTQLITYIKHNSNDYLFTNEEYSFHKCINNTDTQAWNNPIYSDSFYDLINFSGKSIGDIGRESECIYNNNYFYLIQYELDIQSMLAYQQREKDLMTFVNVSQFITGICVYSQCKDFFNYFLNETNNNQLYTFLQQNYYLKNFSVYTKDSYNVTKNLSFHVFTLFIYILLFLIVIRIIFSIVKVFLISTFKLQDKQKEKQRQSKKKEDLVTTEIFSQLSTIDDETDIFFDKYKNRSLLHRFINVLDYSYNIGYLSKNKSRYYDDTGIEIFITIKFISMILLVLNHIIYVAMKLPGTDYLNEDFYQSIYFIIVKFSSFSNIIWIFNESAITGYKFITFIKERAITKKHSIPFIYIIIFFFKTIPKIIIFLIYYYFLHIYIQYLSVFFNSGTKFSQYLNNLHRNRLCENSPHIIFKTFSLLYNNQSFHSQNYKNCFRFSIISLNLFICFIFMLLLIYLCFYFKNKIFDIFIFILMFLNLFTPFLYNKNQQHDYFTLNHLQSSTYSERFPHLFISIYFIGFVIGLTFFYHKDIISQHSLTGNLTKYAPFSFVLSGISFLDRQNNYIKNICMFVIICCLVLQSSIYYLCLKIQKTKTMLIKYTMAIHIYCGFEKTIFVILLLGMMICLLCKYKTSGVVPTKGNLLALSNRIGYAFYCGSNSIIYLTNALFTSISRLTYQYLTFMCIGNFFIVVLISILFTILFEVPIRIILTKITLWIYKKLKKYDNDENYNVANTKALKMIGEIVPIDDSNLLNEE